MAFTLSPKRTQSGFPSGTTVCSETEYSGLSAANSRLLQGVFRYSMLTHLGKRRSRQATQP